MTKARIVRKPLLSYNLELMPSTSPVFVPFLLQVLYLPYKEFFRLSWEEEDQRSTLYHRIPAHSNSTGGRGANATLRGASLIVVALAPMNGTTMSGETTYSQQHELYSKRYPYSHPKLQATRALEATSPL